MSQPRLVISRVVVRVVVLTFALAALYLVYDPLSPTMVETNDDSGLGVGLTVLLLTSMMLLVWGAVAAIWALVDGLRHGWQITPVWVGVVAIMFGIAVLVTEGFGFAPAAVFTTVPVGLGLLVGASVKTVRSHRVGDGGPPAPAPTQPRSLGA